MLTIATPTRPTTVPLVTLRICDREQGATTCTHRSVPRPDRAGPESHAKPLSLGQDLDGGIPQVGGAVGIQRVGPDAAVRVVRVQGLGFVAVLEVAAADAFKQR